MKNKIMVILAWAYIILAVVYWIVLFSSEIYNGITQYPYFGIGIIFSSFLVSIAKILPVSYATLAPWGILIGAIIVIYEWHKKRKA